MPKHLRTEAEGENSGSADATPKKSAFAAADEREVEERRTRTREKSAQANGMDSPGSRQNSGVQVRRESIARQNFSKPVAYFVEPEFGVPDPRYGAQWMKVVLGPAAGASENYGSPPRANTPAIMRQLLDGDGNFFGWVAGHLLNDNLGGQGEACNLTPITTAGNKNHLRVETLIKNFLTQAGSPTLHANSKDYWFGVYYKVSVSKAKWAGKGLYSGVAQHLKVQAHVMKRRRDDPTAISIAAKDDCPFSTYFNPIDEVVDNTGWVGLG